MAFVAHGTTFSINGVVVAELQKINGPQIKRDDVKVTSHDSGQWDEFLPGIITGGEIDCEGNYVPSDEGQLELIAAITAINPVTFEVLFTNGYGFSGDCMLNSFKPSGPYDDKAEISFSVKTTGTITFITPGS